MGVRSQLFGLLLKRNKEGSWESMLRNMLYYMPGLGKKFEEKLQKLRALEDIAEEQKNKMPEKIMNREESREKKNKKEKSFIHS